MDDVQSQNPALFTPGAPLPGPTDSGSDDAAESLDLAPDPSDDVDEPLDEQDAEETDDGGEEDADEGEAAPARKPKPAELELDELRQKAKRLEEIEVQVQQAQAQQAQAQAAQYWHNREAAGENHFAEVRQWIIEQAAQALDPQAFLNEQLPLYHEAYGQWQREERAAREQAIWGYAQRTAAPTQAEKLAKQYGLSDDDAAELAAMRPNDMAAAAKKMAKKSGEIAELRKQIAALEKMVGKASVAGASVAPGRGKSRSGQPEAGSLDQLAALMFGR